MSLGGEGGKDEDPMVKVRTSTVTLLRLHPSHWFCLRQSIYRPTLGTPNFHGVTGGVYKTRERIHRGILIHDY